MSPNSLIRSITDRVASNLKKKGESHSRPLVVETLEPRVLFSGSPAPAPTPVPEAAPASVQEVQPAPAAAASPEASPAVADQPEEAATEQAAPAVSSIPAASEEPAPPTTVDQTQLATIVQAATQRWIESGISTEQADALASASYQIANLGEVSGQILGSAEGNLITIDDDGAGRGWFVDPTPGDNGEFELDAAGSLTSLSTSGIDLLSVLLHEQGHILGLDQGTGADDIMNGVFVTGERRLPGAGQAEGAIAGSLEGVHYATAAVEDNIDAYADGTNLNGLNSGVGWISPWSSLGTHATVETTHPFSASGAAIQIQPTADLGDTGSFLSRDFTAVTDTLYVGIEINKSTGFDNNDFINFQFSDGGSEQLGFGIRNQANNPIFARVQGGSTASTNSSTNADPGTNYQLVAKISKDGSANYNRVDLFIDPAGTTEPGSADAVATTATAITSLSKFNVRHFSPESGDVFWFDNLKLSDTFEGALAPAPVAPNPIITPVSATSSSNIGSGGRIIDQAINGSGLAGAGNSFNVLAETHDFVTQASSGPYWLSGANAVSSGTEELTFALPGASDIDAVHQWVYNRAGGTDRGLRTFNISFSTDNGATFPTTIASTTLGDFTQPPVNTSIESETKTFALQTGVTHIKLTNLQNFGGGYFGLLEMRFGGPAAPSNLAPVITSPDAFSVDENNVNVGTVTANDPDQVQDASLTATGDSFVQKGNATGNFGGVTQVVIKDSNAGSTTRKGYLQFDTSDFAGTAAAAELALTVSLNNQGGGGTTPQTHTVEVYGLSNEALEGWDESTINWNNAPANNTGGDSINTTDATLLGSFTVPNSSAGTTLTFSSQAFADFISANTNEEVTLILRRDGGNGSHNLAFASKENGSLNAATLSITAAAPTFSISGGADATLFSIDANTGDLAFIDVPDFENPGDAGADNIYDVQIEATDSIGSSTVQDVTVTVNDGPSSVSIDGSGNLIVEGGPGSADDDFSISFDSGTDEYVVTNTNGGLNERVDAGTVTGSIIVNGEDGDDTLTLDLTTPFANAVEFNGGTDDGGGDELVINGANGGTHEYTYDDTVSADGFGGMIDLDGQLITYTGLEPITNTGTAADVIFNLPAGADIATLTDGGATMTLDAPTFETTMFNKPTASLTINGGSDDSVELTNDVTLGADITINAGTILLSGNLSTDAVAAAGSVTLAGDVRLNASSTIDTDGTGSDGNVDINGTVAALAASLDFVIDAGSAGNVTIDDHVGRASFTESGGLIVGEGENYTSRSGPASTFWKVAGDEVVPGDNADVIANARGDRYIQLLSDNGGGAGGPLNDPSVQYQIDVTTPGTYQLYVRWEGDQSNFGASDSFFADIVELKDGSGGTIADWYEFSQGLDANFASSPWDGLGGFEQNVAGPANNAVNFVIPAAGTYTLRFTEREDGAAIDAFVLTTGAAPTGTGPAESTRGPRLETFQIVNANNVDVSGEVDAENVVQTTIQGATSVGRIVADDLTIEDGDVTVAFGLEVANSTTVGINGGTASLTVDGGEVILGDGDAGDNFLVGIKNVDDAGTGTVDFSGAASVTTDLNEFIIGRTNSGTTQNGQEGDGTVTLSDTANTVTSDILYLGDTQNGDSASPATLHLGGGSNVFAVEDFGIGRNKSGQGIATGSLVDIDAGGTFTLTGKSGAGNGVLNIGNRVGNTSYIAHGTLDLQDAANVDINIDQIRLGAVDFVGGSPGDAFGTLNLSDTANTITATDIILGYTAGGANDNGATSTMTLGTGTNVVNTETWVVGGRESNGSVTGQTGGSLELYGKGGSGTRADLFVGLNESSTALGTADANTTGTFDVGDMTSFTAELDEFYIGYRTRLNDVAGNGRATGDVTLADSNTIDATTVIVSEAEQFFTQDQSTLTLGATNDIKADTFSVGFTRGNGLVEFGAPGGTLSLTGSSGAAADLSIGATTSGTGNINVGVMDLTGGTFDATLDDLIIGLKNQRTGQSPSGTGTLSFDGGTVTANAIQIGVGQNNGSGDGRGIGTLNVGGTADLTAGSIAIGAGTSPGSIGIINQSGGAIDVTGGISEAGGDGESAINVNAGIMTVAGGLEVDNLVIGSDGGTGSVTVTSGAVEIGEGAGDILDIGVNTDTGVVDGVLDASAASSVTILVDDVRIGFGGNSNALFGTGDLILSDTGANTITADSFVAGDSTNTGNGGLTTVQLGGGINNFNIDDVTISSRKTNVEMTIDGGGTLNLNGKGGVATTANLLIGSNTTGTGTASVGDIDLSGGTFNANLDQLLIGRHTSGNGNGQGTLTFDAGTVDVVDVILAEPNLAGGSSSSLNPSNTTGTIIMNGGNFSVSGDLTVGLNGGVGTFDANGGTVSIGTGAGSNLYVGRRDQGVAEDAGQIVSTMDLTGVTMFTANVGDLGVATVVNGGAGQTRPGGVLTLASDNDITADTITIGNSQSVGLGGSMANAIHLGAANQINAGTIVVGGSKSIGTPKGVLDFAAAGSSATFGSDADRADLFVGRQIGGTGGGSQGEVDFSGSTVTGFFDQIVIGSKPDNATGTTLGTFTMDMGTVEANSLLLGERTTAGGAGSVTGTFNLGGGILDLLGGDIDDGGGTAVFNFTGGTLRDVDTFGFALDQDKSGGLLQVGPDATIDLMTVSGDYTGAAGGNLEIGVDGTAGAGATAGHDQLIVNGIVTLDNLTLDITFDDFLAENGDSFTIIDNNGTVDLVVGTFDGLPEGSVFFAPGGQTFAITYTGGDGNDVVLEALGETGVRIIGGDLFVSDISGSDSDDNLSISTDATSVIIHDPNLVLTTDIPGASRPDVNTVVVPFALFTNMFVQTGGGADNIDLDSLQGLPGSLTVDGEADFDTIDIDRVTATFVDGASLDFDAEEIMLTLADLTVGGTGSIDLNATDPTSASGGTMTYNGLWLYGSDLEATGTGTITLAGEGGDTGTNNNGIKLTNGSEVTTADGDIDIDGTGGGDALYGTGVALHHSSSVSAGGNGDLTIDGTGSAGTSSNEGVFLGTGTGATVTDGDLTITGTATGDGSQNQGVDFTGATLAATGTGNITVTGSGSGSGTNNIGLSTTATDIATTTGTVTLTGTGGTGTSNNQGVRLASTDVTTAGGSIDIDGQGNGTGSGVYNTGVQLAGTTLEVTAGAGTIDIDGTAGDGTALNDGVQITAGSAVTTETGAIGIRGTGMGAFTGNRGANLIASTVGSTSGDITILGTGSETSTAVLNDGVSLSNSHATTAGTLKIAGTGGTGSLLNNGVKVVGGSLSGVLDIDGIGGGDSATGSSNAGVYILNSDLTGALAGSAVDGTGGFGGGLNLGAYLQGTMWGALTTDDVTTSPDNEEDEKGGNFFSILPLALVAAERRSISATRDNRRKKAEAHEAQTLQAIADSSLTFLPSSNQDINSGDTIIFDGADRTPILVDSSQLDRQLDLPLSLAVSPESYRAIFISETNDGGIMGLMAPMGKDGKLTDQATPIPARYARALYQITAAQNSSCKTKNLSRQIEKSIVPDWIGTDLEKSTNPTNLIEDRIKAQTTLFGIS